MASSRLQATRIKTIVVGASTDSGWPSHRILNWTDRSPTASAGVSMTLMSLSVVCTVFEAFPNPFEVLSDCSGAAQPDPGEIIGLDGVVGHHRG